MGTNLRVRPVNLSDTDSADARSQPVSGRRVLVSWTVTVAAASRLPYPTYPRPSPTPNLLSDLLPALRYFQFFLPVTLDIIFTFFFSIHFYKKKFFVFKILFIEFNGVEDFLNFDFPFKLSRRI